jgi:ABC-2 type transport system permease protein
VSRTGQKERRGGRMMRLKGMIRKEALQVVRDPSSIAIAFVLPLVLLFLFGYGVSLDAKHVPVGMVVEAPSAQTASLVSAFGNSQYFRPRLYRTFQTAEGDLRRGELDAVIWLRSNFDRALLTPGPAPIGVIVDGVDANHARIVKGYIQGAWRSWLEQYARENGVRLAAPIELQQRIWFNHAVRSRNFLVPGLIAVIMTLIGALLTAMVVAREWERGTMEALMITPITSGEIILGKLIPYFLLGMGGLALSVAMAVWLFQVPLRGSLMVLFGVSALFLLVALGMGLFISTVSKNQFVAGQIAIIATFLPAFILSGFIFNIGSMPKAVQVLTYGIAARYFVAVLKSVFLAGNVWPVIWVNALALVVMAAAFLGLVRLRTAKRLE